MKCDTIPRWYVIYATVLMVAAIIAGCVTSHWTPATYTNPEHPALFSNLTVSVPAPPGLVATTNTLRVAVSRAALAQVVVPPVKTNKISVVEYVPANGGNDTNRRWMTLLSSHDLKTWTPVTSNEQVSGYYVTNNVTSTNRYTFFDTVSE